MTDSPYGDPPSGDGWRLLTDQKITGNRISLPRKSVERHGISEGDYLDLVVILDNGTRIEVNEKPVSGRERLYFRKYRVENHNMNGRYADLWWRPTGGQEDE